MNPVGYFHLAMVDKWHQVLEDLDSWVHHSGLLEVIPRIKTCVVGGDVPILPHWCEPIGCHQDPKVYEFFTLDRLWQDAKQMPPDTPVLYFHTKGATSDTMWWRRYMCHWAMRCARSCIKSLKYADVVGCEQRWEPRHFHGNFWWARAGHLANLPQPSLSNGDRVQAEMWVAGNQARMWGIAPTTMRNFYHEAPFRPDEMPVCVPAVEKVAVDQPEVGVVIPSWVWGEPTRDLTLQCLSRIRSKLPVKVWMISNRLHPWLPEDFAKQCQEVCAFPVEYVYEPCRDFGVAGAWNEGIRRAFDAGCRYAMIMAHDCFLDDNCIENLVKFGDKTPPEVAIWSAFDTNNRELQPGNVANGADFTCAMLRPETIDRLGWFDSNTFIAPYFEDNDYMVRVLLAKMRAHIVCDAHMFHLGSMTIKLCPHAKSVVQANFETNRRKFAEKWGTSNPPHTVQEAEGWCYKSPWNKGGPLSYCGG